MRVGLAIEQFDPHRGGAEQWTCQFAERLLRRGHEVHVVASSFSPAGLKLPIMPHRVRKQRTKWAKAAATEALLRQLPLDIVHDMGIGWYCDVFLSHDGSRRAQSEAKLAALPSCLRPVKRKLLSVLPRHREFDRLSRRQFAPGRRILVALSHMVARDFQKYHAVEPERIRVVHNGVDTQAFSPQHRDRYRNVIRARLRVARHEMLVLFVGHDFRRKNLATAIQAVARVARAGQPVRLAVAGGRRLRSAQLAVARLGLQERVTFLGSVPDCTPYYAAADVYVLPTFYDPCSLGVLEAVASGLPSITTRLNGAGELLTDGVDGYLLDDPANVQQLAERLQSLLDPARREQMGSAAHALALRHTMDHNCDRMLEIYDEILAQRAAEVVLPAPTLIPMPTQAWPQRRSA